MDTEELITVLKEDGHTVVFLCSQDMPTEDDRGAYRERLIVDGRGIMLARMVFPECTEWWATYWPHRPPLFPLPPGADDVELDDPAKAAHKIIDFGSF